MPYPFSHFSFFTHCYRQRACSTLPYPPFIWGNLIFNVMMFGIGVFGRWISHEEGALINGIGAFIKETPQRAPLFLPPWEDTVRRLLSMNEEQDSSADTESTSWCLDLRVPISRTVRKGFLLSMVFCHSSPNRVGQHPSETWRLANSISLAGSFNSPGK